MSLPRPVLECVDATFGIFTHRGPVLGACMGRSNRRARYGRGPRLICAPNAELPERARHRREPTAQYHRQVYGAAGYDAFIDAWHAERFDADELMDLIQR
jgi:alpha-L-fucosidase